MELAESSLLFMGLNNTVNAILDGVFIDKSVLYMIEKGNDGIRVYAVFACLFFYSRIIHRYTVLNIQLY